METFKIHYELAACEIVGHQTRNSRMLVGCTCARLANKNHMENVDPGELPRAEESDSPQTFTSSYHFCPSAPEKLSSSVVSLPVYTYLIYHQFLAM